LLAAPDFVAPLFNQVVPDDGSALALGIDAIDADGNALTISAVSDDANLTVFIPQGNRFASFNFTENDGTVIGSVVAEIFETRGGDAASRIITLATNEVNSDGALNPGGTPFYTDVLVHRIADLTGAADQSGLITQTGDAQFGNGTGGSPLGDFDDQFNLQDGLSFFGRGVLAMANSGSNTNDSQIFFTNGDVTHLNGNHMILGQIVSGFDVLDLVNAFDSGGSLLASVDIDVNTEDGSISLAGLPGWDGRAEVTISLDDGTGNITQQQITVVSQAVLGNVPTINLINDQLIPAGLTAQFTVTDDGGLPMNLKLTTSTFEPMEQPIDPNGITGVLTLQPPDDANLIYEIRIEAEEAGFEVDRSTDRFIKAVSQTADAPPILGLASSLEAEHIFGSFLDGDRLYFANGTFGLDIYDVSNPGNPVLLGFADTAGIARDVLVIDDIAFVADGANGLISLDVSNPASIQPLDITFNGHPANNVFIEGNIAYIPSGGDGLVTYDISDNTNITQLGMFDEFSPELDVSDAIDVAKKDNIVFLTDPNQGIFAIDVTDPQNMAFKVLFAREDDLNPEGMDLDRDVLYVTTVNGLSMFDVSVPDIPTLIVNVPLSNFPSHVEVSDGLAVVSALGGFFFLDVSNPLTPSLPYVFGATRFSNDNMPAVDIAGKPSINGSLIALPLSNNGTLIMDGQSLVHRPEVTEVQVNHGLALLAGPTQLNVQRSELSNLTFTFSGQVSVDINDVEMIALGMDPGVDSPTPIALTQDDLTVTANTDGTYDLTIDLQNHTQADGVFEVRLKPSLTAATGLTLHDSMDYVYRTHQLLGDIDGDGSFNGSPAEIATFAHWFTQSSGVPDFLDTNGSGGFNILDMGPFVQSFGSVLTYTNPNGFVAQGSSASLLPASAANTASSGSLMQLLQGATTTSEVQAPSPLSVASLWQPSSTVTSIKAGSSLQLVAIESEDDSDDEFITTQHVV